MLHKKDYDEETANNFLAQSDYYGLVTYLTQFEMDNPVEQSEWNAHVCSIRTKGTIYNNMLKNSDDKDAIIFTSGLQQGYVNEETKYGQQYTKALQSIGSTNDENATGLKVRFQDDETYSNFLLNLGLSEKELEDKNLTLGQENGIRTLSVDKSNTFIPTILQSLYNIKPSRILKTVNDLGQIMSQSSKSTQMPVMYSEFNENNIFGFDVIGLNAEEKEIKNSNIPIHKLNRINNIVQRAKDKYNQVSDGINKDPIQNELITSDFKGARHQKLIGFLNNKQIDRNTFNDYEKRIDEFYKSEIANAGFTKYNVYLEGKLNNFEEITDPEEKQKLEEQVRQSILNNKNVTYQAAMSGNMFGTLITIPAIPDNKSKELPEQGNLKNLNTNAQYRVFIPGLFDDDAEKSFDRDTQTRAIKQHYLLKINDGTQYLSDGSSITNITEDGGILKDIKTGKDIPLTTSEILKYLDREYLLEDAISHYGREYNEIKDRKLGVIGEGPNTIILGNTKTIDDLGTEIAYQCKEMCKELVPDEKSNEYVNEVFKMYMNILNAIGYEGTPKITLIQNNNNQ